MLRSPVKLEYVVMTISCCSKKGTLLFLSGPW